MDANKSEFQLATIQGRVSLVSIAEPDKALLYVDFLTGASGHRMRYGQEGKNSLLGRACGLHLYGRSSVLDLTAGLGGDAFVLASLGCDVTMVERNPLLWELLSDGLLRLENRAVDLQDHKLLAIKSRLSLVHADSLTWLEENGETMGGVDVVYLDPMYPARKKSALVKSEMQILSLLVGKDVDASSLLEPALQVAAKRVVVKRMLKAETLTSLTPHHSLKGKSIRYDVYSHYRK